MLIISNVMELHVRGEIHKFYQIEIKCLLRQSIQVVYKKIVTAVMSRPELNLLFNN